MRPMTVLSKQSAEEYKKQNYTQRMSSKNMPVSPHVMIYAFPVVAWGSVAVRATGVMLWAGMSGVACLSAAGVDPVPVMQSVGDSSLAPAAKLCVSFPLAYHFLGGVRHAYWDATPEAVTNEQVERASYAVAGGAICATAVACVL